MIKLGLYVASTCFATQIASRNLLSKRTLFAKLRKNTYIIELNTQQFDCFFWFDQFSLDVKILSRVFVRSFLMMSAWNFSGLAIT